VVTPSTTVALPEFMSAIMKSSAAGSPTSMQSAFTVTTLSSAKRYLEQLVESIIVFMVYPLSKIEVADRALPAGMGETVADSEPSV